MSYNKRELQKEIFTEASKIISDNKNNELNNFLLQEDMYLLEENIFSKLFKKFKLYIQMKKCKKNLESTESFFKSTIDCVDTLILNKDRFIEVHQEFEGYLRKEVSKIKLQKERYKPDSNLFVSAFLVCYSLNYIYTQGCAQVYKYIIEKLESLDNYKDIVKGLKQPFKKYIDDETTEYKNIIKLCKEIKKEMETNKIKSNDIYLNFVVDESFFDKHSSYNLHLIKNNIDNIFEDYIDDSIRMNDYNKTKNESVNVIEESSFISSLMDDDDEDYYL